MSGFKWFEDSVETTKLDIGNGFWIEARNFLTVEDHLYIQSAGLVALRAQNDVPKSQQMDIRIDSVRQKIARMEKYIVRWNATRTNPKTKREEPVAVSSDAFRNLSLAAFDAIEKALDQHIERQATEGKETGATDGAPSSTPADSSDAATTSTSDSPMSS